MGNYRHEQALRELQRRRLENGPRSGAAIKANRAKPTPQQEFNALKHGYQRRKEEFFKNLNHNKARTVSGAPSRPSKAKQREIRSKMASKTLPPGGIRHAPPPVKKGFLTRRVDGSPVRRPKSLAIEPKAASLLPAVVPARIGRQVTQQQQPSRRRYT